MKKQIKILLNKNIYVNLIWFVIPLVATLLQTLYDNGFNNYLIYKYVYIHTLEKKNLFAHYPSEYIDLNHYGILFSLIIAPFYYIPDRLAILIYQFLQLLGLHYVIRRLPFSDFKQNILLLFLLFEAIANCQNVQTNTFIGFIFVGTYVAITNKSELKAAFLILLGFLVKIYGIVALGLFFFVEKKLKFIFGLFLFAAILYFLPLLITDLDFINESYLSWFRELTTKNGTNTALDNQHQNMSAIGIVMRILQNNEFNILLIILPAFILQIAPLLHFKLFRNTIFQLRYLAALMLFTILYSSSTETSTHIIGAIGIGIWWLTQNDYKSKKMLTFIICCFLLGTISTTDLVPNYFNVAIVRKYALKALPYWIVWFICIYQLMRFKMQKEAEIVL
ncbi:MAG: glycosyltransferase family 87 protein [Phycisphaerales bacterium]|nr:glycosyltransferase family 87 protein [Phycisphaerales bacterium]